MPASRLSTSWVALSPSRLKSGSPAADALAVALEPADEGPFLHVPAESGNGDLDRHRCVLSFIPAMRSRIAWAIALGRGDDGGFQGRTVRRRREGTVEPADRRIEIVESLVGQLRGDLGADAERGERLVDDQQPAGLGDRAADRLDVERGDRARIDQLDRDAFLRQAVADLLARGAPSGPVRRP